MQVLNFNAEVEQEHSVLNWVSKAEENLIQYEIEKSDDGINFIKIGTVAATGSLVSEQQYSFVDPVLLQGKAYYRLKMIATGNSTYKYSAVLNLNTKGAGEFELTNLVNPFVSKINFQLNAPHGEKIRVELLDVSGRIIQQTKMTVQKGANMFDINIVTALQKGTYLLRINTSNGTINKMMQHQ